MDQTYRADLEQILSEQIRNKHPNIPTVTLEKSILHIIQACNTAIDDLESNKIKHHWLVQVNNDTLSRSNSFHSIQLDEDDEKKLENLKSLPITGTEAKIIHESNIIEYINPIGGKKYMRLSKDVRQLLQQLYTQNHKMFSVTNFKVNFGKKVFGSSKSNDEINELTQKLIDGDKQITFQNLCDILKVLSENKLLFVYKIENIDFNDLWKKTKKHPTNK